MGRKIVSCPICRKSFRCEKEGLSHIQTMHKKETFCKNIEFRVNALNK